MDPLVLQTLAKQGFVDDSLAPHRRRRVAPTQRAGASGTAVFGGQLQEREANQKLTGRQRYQTFSEILANVSIVSSATRFFLQLMAKAEWKVEPAEDGGARGEQIAEAVELALDSMDTPLRKVARRTSMAKFYGFSWQEWIARRLADGMIGFSDIETRPQITIERWDMMEGGKVAGVLQRDPQTQRELYIPRAKAIYLVDDTLNDSPEGLGLFRHIVQPASDLLRLEELEKIGFATDLNGIPIARAPLAQMIEDGLDKAVREERVAELREMVQDHVRNLKSGLLLDSITYETDDEAARPSNVRQWDFELLKGGSSAFEAVANAIMRKSREIARVFGLESMLLGETGAGSLAMSRDKSKNFFLLAAGTLGEVADALNKDVVEPLMELNGWPMELKPTLKPDAIQHRDVEEITAALADMARAGAVLAPDDPVINEVRDLLGLSRQPEIDLDLAADLGGTQNRNGATDREMEREDVDRMVDDPSNNQET